MADEESNLPKNESEAPKVEESQPVSPEVSSDPPSPDRRFPRPFSLTATLIWSILVIGGSSSSLLFISDNREHLLENPDRYLSRIIDRELVTAGATPLVPQWQQRINAWDTSTLQDTLDDSIELYQHFLAEGALKKPDEIRPALAILLAEAGRVQEADREVAELPLENDQAQIFRDLFHQAYSEKPIPKQQEAPTPESRKRGAHLERSQVNSNKVSALEEYVQLEWARTKLQQHLAAREKDQATSSRLQTELDSKGVAMQGRITALASTNLWLVLIGLVLGAAWVWRRDSELEPASRILIPPWTVLDGYSVLVRGAGLAFLLAGCLALAAEKVPELLGIATLVSAIPVLWLTRRYLVAPYNGTISSFFGLFPAPNRWLPILGWSAAGIAAMILGENVLSAVFSSSHPSSIIESVPEEFLFDNPVQVALSSLDAVVWAPIFEEIIFRGILYGTLRRRMEPINAAVLAAIIFGSVHGYSWQGFMVICWSGFLWSLTYEYTGSLLPGMICHFVGNALAVASPIVMYRL